jgi:hypothetical protein
MALTVNHPTLREQATTVTSTSIGASPVAAYARVPFRGKIQKLFAVTQGMITTTDCTVTVAVNGTAVGSFTIPVASAAAGQFATGATTTQLLAAVNEDDVISFTPSGSAGAAIACKFGAVIQVA